METEVQTHVFYIIYFFKLKVSFSKVMFQTEYLADVFISAMFSDHKSKVWCIYILMR